MAQASSRAQSSSATAIVAYEPSRPGKPTWRHQNLALNRNAPGKHEVLVRVIASGICHSDIVVGTVPQGVYGSYPKVLGHEGSGYVVAVGSSVTGVSVGDPVLLSYTYCGECDLCQEGRLTYCENFSVENTVCREKVWTTMDSDKGASAEVGGDEIGGKFFGQSSFASLSMVDEKSVVNVKGLLQGDDAEQQEELKKLSCLGCGLMTGSGAVLNTAGAKPHHTVVVAGLGAVGLGAIMAAKIAGCRTIIAVDKIAARLALARDLGATQTLDTAPYDIKSEDYAASISEEIKKLARDGKVNFALDTTGILPIMNACIKSLSKMGRMLQIGVPVPSPTLVLPLDMLDFFRGTKKFEINYLGDSLAADHIPKMIQWYREGRFPFDRLVKFYEAKDFERALEDMKGDVVKPILLH